MRLAPTRPEINNGNVKSCKHMKKSIPTLMYGWRRVTYNPLLDVLVFGYGLTPIHHEKPETLESACFNTIPIPEKKFLNKIKSDGEYLKKSRISFDIQTMTRMVDVVEKSKYSSDTAVFVIVFYAIVLTEDTRNHTVPNLKSAMRGLNVIKSNALGGARIYAFGKLADIIITSSQADEDLVSLVIYHFAINESLTKDTFPLMNRVVSYVFALGNTQLTETMFSTLLKIIETEQKILDYDKINELMKELEPSVTKLHGVSLRIFGLLSRRIEDSSIRSLAGQIPSSLARFVSREKPLTVFPVVVESEREPFIRRNGNMTLIVTDFPGEFERLPLEEMRNCVNIEDLLSCKMRDYVTRVKGFLEVASLHSQEFFVAEMCRVVEAVKAHPMYAQVLMAFMCLFQSFLKKSDTIVILLPFLLQSALFSEKLSIFNNDSGDIVCNSMKQAVFRMMGDYSPDFAGFALTCLKDKPFVCVELLCWLFDNLEKFNMHHLFREGTLDAIFETGERLQQRVHTPGVVKCRSAFFVVLTSLAREYHYFTREFFTEKYLWYIFEKGLTKTIITTFRQCLSNGEETEAVFPSLCLERVFQVCILAEGEYIGLAEDISTAVAKGMCVSPTWMTCFHGFIDMFLEGAKKVKSEILLINALDLSVVRSMRDDTYHLSLAKGIEIVRCIDIVYGCEPGDDVKWLLLALMTQSRLFHSRCLIRVPTAIPIVLAAFGRSKFIGEILDLLEGFLDYSRYNKIMAHAGLLDLVLVQYVSRRNGAITLNDNSFDFCGDFEQCERIVRKISQVKSNLGILHQLIDAVHSEDEANKVVSMLSMAIPDGSVPQFGLGVVPAQFLVEGVSADDVNNGFSVSFRMMTDLAAWPRFHCEAVIFSMRDRASRTLNVTLVRDTLSSSIVADGVKTSVIITKGIPTCTPMDIALRFELGKDLCVKISAQFNQRDFNDSELCDFQFLKGPLSIEGGGCLSVQVSKKKDFAVTGVLSDFVLYSGDSSLGHLRDMDILFESNDIVSARPEQNHTKQECSSVVVFPGSIVLAEANILRVALTSDVVNQLLQKYEIPGMLSGVKLLLSFSEIPQRHMDVESFLEFLLGQNECNWFLYHQLHDFMSIITFEPLLDTWVKSVLMNLWLWRKAGPFELKLIMTKWLDLIDMNSAIFLGKHFYSHLLHHFRIFFTNDLVDFHDASRFDSRFSESSIIEIRSLFLLVMRKVAAVSLSESDIMKFIWYVGHLENKDILMALLSVLCDVGEFVPQGADFRLLYQLLGRDLDVDIMVLRTIHKLAKENVFKSVLTMYPLLNDSRILDIILDSFIELPNTFPLVCMLALKFERIDVMETLGEKMLPSVRAAISSNYGWFLFPLIVLLNAKELHMRLVIARLIHDVMISDELTDIVLFLSFLSYQLGDTEPSSLILLILNETRDVVQKDTLAEVCFNCSFFHFSQLTYHNLLLDAMNESYEISIDPEEPRTFLKEIRTSEQIHTLISSLNEGHTPEMSFGIFLDERSHWKDREIAQMGLDLLRTMKGDHMKISILRYFLEKQALKCAPLREIAKSLSEEIPRRQTEYRNDASHRLYLMLDRLELYLEPNLERANSSITHDQFENETRQTFMKLVTSPKSNQLKFIRDETFCTFYAPMKMKRRVPRKPVAICDGLTPLFRTPCLMVKESKVKPAVFAVTEHQLLVNEKSYSLKNAHVFCRKRLGDECAIEFYLRSGKAILLDFSPIPSSDVIRHLQKLQCLRGKIHESASTWIATYTNQWRNREISNLEYLMKLNIAAGRSFNDIDLHPLLPSITARHLSQDTRDALWFFLPSLFKNDFESLYTMITSLETEVATAEIPSFIDTYFGFKMMEDLPHIHVFTKQHPRRSPLNEILPCRDDLPILESGLVRFCTIIEQSSEHLKLILLTTENETREVCVRLPSYTIVSDSVIESNVMTGCEVCGYGNYILVYDKDLIRAVILRKGKTVYTQDLYLETSKAFCCGKNEIVFCRDHFTVVVKTEDKYELLCETDSHIGILAVNPDFKMFAVATRNGYVSLYSLNKGAFVNRVCIGKKVNFLVMAKILGFVVVFTDESVLVFTCDGDEVARCELNLKVIRVYPFVGNNGVDFVAFETKEHNLCFFDVFHPGRVSLITDSVSDTISVVYAPSITAFVVLFKNGSLRVIPYKMS